MEWLLPLPPPPHRHHNSRQRNRSSSNSCTPLLPARRRSSRPSPDLSTSSTATQQKFSYPSRSSERSYLMDTSADSSTRMNLSFREGGDHSVDEGKPTGLSGFFFGFMYEEPFEDSFDRGDSDALEENRSNQTIWNPLNLALCAMYTLTTAAATVPVLIVPTIAKEMEQEDTSGFASRAVASAVMGTACGKFLNGPIGDVMGARRTSVLFSFLLSLALLSMGICKERSSAIWACFFVEFFQSVQWPCIVITLATHYGSMHQRQTSKSSLSLYEGGIYMTSIAARFGSLLAIPLFSTILKDTSQWRWVCFMGTWSALIGTSVAYLFLADSPHQIDEPQNPLQSSVLKQTSNLPLSPRHLIRITKKILYSMLMDNLLPSLRHVLKSGTFWIVALAHTGSSMIRTSERIITTYYHDTSMGFLSQEKASGLSVFASLGTILGLSTCGTYFTSLSQEQHRKQFISRLYMFTIASCYALAIFAIPAVYNTMNAPGLVLFFQIFASFCMSFGISVMLLIPGLVGSAFGNHKGLFSAYVDGVAYGIASFVWKIVGSSVSDNVAGVGWAYGWAAVALLVILCAILMTEFFEHYFVRPNRRNGMGTYETIILA